MSINISKNYFRLRMSQEQFQKLNEEDFFIEELSNNQQKIFLYTVKLKDCDSPILEFKANEIIIFLPHSIKKLLLEKNKKDGIEYNISNLYYLIVQLDIMKTKKI